MADLAPFTGTLPYFADPTRSVTTSSSGSLRVGPLTVLFCWELGGGLGHLMQMLALAQDLAKAGHRVYVALRELDKAGALYGAAGVSFLQAPVWLSGAAQFARPVTYAQMLANCGFGAKSALFARACAWRNLMMMVAPGLVVFDHAPTALLAARGLPRFREKR